jgi:hypothetical protein
MLGAILGQLSTVEITLAALTTFIAWVGGGESVGKWLGTAVAIYSGKDREFLAAFGGTVGGACGIGIFLGFIAGGGHFEPEMLSL